MALQYNASNGALLYLDTGANAGDLARACCCVIDCNSCAAETLAWTYNVTITGMTQQGNNEDQFNDSYTLTYTAGCQWSISGSKGGTLYVLGISWAGADWTLTLIMGYTPEQNCVWASTSTDGCDPTGSYTLFSGSTTCTGSSAVVS